MPSMVTACETRGSRDLERAVAQGCRHGMRQRPRANPCGRPESAEAGQADPRHPGFVMDEYHQEKIQRGSCSASSAQHEQAALRAWLADFLEEDIGKLTPKRAALRYERLVNTPTRKTGQPPTAAIHRFGLSRGSGCSAGL